MKPEYPERIRVWQNEPNKEFVASFPGDLYVEENSEYIRRDLHESALLDAHRRGRREGMEEAAKLLDEGYSREVGHHYRKDRQPSKHDRCPHGRYTYEDCESCGAAAIRAKAQSNA